MRVVVNQWTSIGKKTGVGYYAEQLLRALRGLQNGDEFAGFPPAWLQKMQALWRRVEQRPDNDSRKSKPGRWRATWQRCRQAAREQARRATQTLLTWHFRARCAWQPPDLYHEPNYIPLPCTCATVATVHDLSPLLFPEWHPPDRALFFERQFPRALSQCAHFVAVSAFTRREMLRHLNLTPDRVTSVGNGLREDVMPLPSECVAPVLKQLGLPARFLLCVGTIEPRKNLHLLLRAYCSLPEAVRGKWPLVLVGGWGWNVDELRDYWDREARHRGVIHLGYVADQHLPAIYNGARALLYPSLYEGFGLPPIEMMACGGAVLASTAGAVEETVGPHAYLISPHDIDGWRDALLRVVSDDDWWHRLRYGVVDWARQFSWRRCALETLAVYRRVCGKETLEGLAARAA